MPEDLKPWFPLRTERLLLREIREGDFDDVHAYAVDPLVARFMDWGPNTHDETVTHMALKLDEQTRWPRDEVTLAIEHLADGLVIGTIRLAVSDRANLTGDFGYSLHSAYWRQGFATEAARAVIGAGFRALGLHRIWAECDVDNVGSWSVMKKLGMRREAHFRDGKQVKGLWRDRYLYAVLADEWISPG
ncbi:MAG TPA: GNAT family protein [Phenylobacterium sp.]|jgi:ribosomal-protein-alanine N-acetyltransferase|nr:GNAT family protein [Phenylobacterium sp.]